jgi:hypothetical protein
VTRQISFDPNLNRFRFFVGGNRGFAQIRLNEIPGGGFNRLLLPINLFAFLPDCDPWTPKVADGVSSRGVVQSQLLGRIIGYLFRRTFDESWRLNIDGQVISRTGGRVYLGSYHLYLNGNPKKDLARLFKWVRQANGHSRAPGLVRREGD